MQHVSPKWLWRFEMGLCVFHALLAGFLLFEIITNPTAAPTEMTNHQHTAATATHGAKTSSQHVGGVYGPIAIITLSVFFIIYVVVFLRRHQQRWPDIPHTVAIAFSGSIIALGTQLGTGAHTLNHAAYILFGFLGAMAGMIPVLVSAIVAFLALIVVTFSGAHAANGTAEQHMIEMIYVVSGMFTGLLGWLVFRRWYVPSAHFNKLSDMLNQEQFKSSIILESITDGVMVINTKGTVQILNKSAAAMLGWQHDQAVNLDYRSLIQIKEELHPKKTDADTSESAISRSLQKGTVEQGLSLLQTQNNRQRYVDIVASPIFQNVVDPITRESAKQLVGVITVLRDVDEQQREQKQRSDFISTASHEMRTPVASIQGFIELALNPKVSTIDEKAKGYLTKAYQATKHLGQLFRDLLTASQSDDGQLQFQPQIIDVTEFLGKIVEEQKITAQQKGLEMIFDKKMTAKTDEKQLTPLLYLYADPNRLREVLLNLLENAVKYTSKGVVTVGVSLSDKTITIRVSDTGMGIASEDIPHLFQKFYRTDNSATREIGGTGLGLYIAKQIVDVMNGQIWVESTVGAGSTFYVALPRISQEEITRMRTQVVQPGSAAKP